MEILLKTKLNKISSHSMLRMLTVCPALIVTTTASRALILSLALAITLFGAELIVSLIKNIISPKLRALVYITVTAFCASLAEILTKALFPLGAAALGVYLPIIAVSSIVLMRVESCAAKSSVFVSLLDALICSGQFFLIMTVTGVIREFFGAGTLFASPDGNGGITVFSSAPIPFLASTAGVIMLTAFAAAFAKFLRNRRDTVAKET